MTEPDNLWGTDLFQPADEAVPKQILLDQAAILEKITNRSVFATVESGQEGGYIEISGDAVFPYWSHRLAVFVPSIESYTVSLLAVCHGIDMYPCKIRAARVRIERDCPGETELRQVIKQVLSDPDTVKIIRALMAQAKAA